MAKLQRLTIFSVIVAAVTVVSGIAGASIFFNNPIAVSTNSASPVLGFSSSGSSAGINPVISQNLTQLNANVSFKGITSDSTYSTSSMFLKPGNYTVNSKNMTGFRSTVNPIAVNVTDQISTNGVLYTPLNYTNYSYARSTVFDKFPFESANLGHIDKNVKVQSEEFSVSGGAFVNTVSMLLSGSGTVLVSLGTTLFGSQIVQNDIIYVNGLNYYSITFPAVFLGGETPYFLNLFNVTGHPSWQSVYSQGNQTANSLNNLGEIGTYVQSGSSSQFLRIGAFGNNGNSHAVFTGIYSVGFNPRAGAFPTNTLIFYEYGLPQATNWSVSLNGTTYYSQTRFIQVNDVNGTLPYHVYSTAGYVPVASDGTSSMGPYSLVVPVVFYSSGEAMVAGSNSSRVGYSSLGFSQEFNAINGGIFNHISLLLSGTGSVNISIGYSSYGDQIMKNVTINSSGNSGLWYSVLVPLTFLSGANDYFLNMYEINGAVKCAFSEPYGNGFTGFTLDASYSGMPFWSLDHVFNLSYSGSQAFNGTSTVYFIEYGIPTGTSWGVEILSETQITLGSLVSLEGGTWESFAHLDGISGVNDPVGLTFVISNATQSAIQFTYLNGQSSGNGTPIGLASGNNLLLSVSIVPVGSGHGVQTFTVYIISSSHSNGSIVSITYAVTINVSFSFFEN